MKPYVYLSRCLCIFLVVAMLSCQESLTPTTPGISSENNLTVKDAFRYFTNDLVPSSSVIRKADEKAIPLWRFATIHLATEKSPSFVDIPLFDQYNNLPERRFRKLVIAKSPDKGTVHSIVMEVTADEEYARNNNEIKSDNFSGTVLFSQWGDMPFGGYRFKNGKPIETISDIKVNTNSISRANSNSGARVNQCWVVPTFQTCTDLSFFVFAYGSAGQVTANGSFCQYDGYQLMCDFPFQYDQISSANSYGGTPPSNGTEIPGVFVNFNVRSCIKTVINRTLQASGSPSGIAASVLTMTNGSSDMQEGCGVTDFMTSLFGPDSKFQIRINEAAGYQMQVNAEDGTVQTKHASTQFSQNGMVADIWLNADYLSRATDLAVARTITHEIMHCYFQYLTATCPQVAQKQLDGLKSFLKKYPDANQNSQEHQLMADRYMNQMTGILGTFAALNNITIPSNPPDYLYYLVYGGLGVYESDSSDPRNATYRGLVIGLSNRDQNTATNIDRKESNNKSGSSGTKECQ